MDARSVWLDDRMLVAEVVVAKSLLARMRGLLGRYGLPAGHGLLIPRCGAVHTIGMQFPLDLLFLDRTGHLCRSVWNVPPGQLCVRGGKGADCVLEVAAGWLDRRDIVPGTLLRVISATRREAAAAT